MPTVVRAHRARRGKTRYRVRAYVRTGPEHTGAWKRCVRGVGAENRRRKTDYNPFAVCSASIGRGGTVFITQPHTARKARRVRGRKT